MPSPSALVGSSPKPGGFWQRREDLLKRVESWREGGHEVERGRRPTDPLSQCFRRRNRRPIDSGGKFHPSFDTVGRFELRRGATHDPRVQETPLPSSPLPSMSRYLANCRLLHPNDSDVRIAWHRMHSRGMAVSLGISRPYHIQPLEKPR